ncbi:MAG TPA: UDP-N-acetylglucosamine diphosphorylase/glucosamine-1-phosphate N-acetyltransferase [Gammaproteobacteria bacterium]|nr:UDP-N-acetylglucosamine diphosphorylase/glucosamine-1-phosphate N-acetyltransferase [Gammaproteobacteria bacterium]
MALQVVILAAGAGTRMKSKLPKVLQPLAGKPLLGHVLSAAQKLHPEDILVVYGHGGDAVRSAYQHHSLLWVEQEEQLGTGHAAQLAMASVDDDDATILILYGDVPLLTAETLSTLIQRSNKKTLSLLTVSLEDPTGYGRVVRIDDKVQAIVEQKDATSEQLAIKEINTGILAVPAGPLKRWLQHLNCDNAQQEYYLTDIIELAVGDGFTVETCSPRNSNEVMGVNDKIQLANLERQWQWTQAEHLMQQGVTLVDPHRLDIRGTLEVGQDVFIDANVVIEGPVVLGDGCHIGPFCHIKDAVLGCDVRINSHTVIDSATVGDNCIIGPFARLRPDTKLDTKVHVGNFVELKKSEVAHGSKINHLAYIGDAEIGRHVNVGAGTITCNYDGLAKHKTVIKEGAFIGSDTQLGAPVIVGAGAVIGAGSTITKDTPDNELTLSRSEQKTIKGWMKKHRPE